MKTKEVIKFYEFEDKKFKCCAIKFHKDGRMFVCGVDPKSDPIGKHGGIVAIDPLTKGMEFVVKGVNVDDMCFDKEGNIYYTNYIGTPENPNGSIEFLSADGKDTRTVAHHMASPNGIALSPDESILWVTETNTGVLHRILLNDPMHSTTPYHFEGFLGPDSCEIDEDGNLYVAMARQGRVLVFNPQGFLIAEIITPGCEKDVQLGTTHPMVHPDRKEVYITCHDINGDYGANILYVGSFAKGNANMYQFT